MKKSILLILFVFLAVGVSGSYAPAKYTSPYFEITDAGKTILPPGDDITKEFTVKKGQLLKIDSEAGGGIKIQGWDKDVVKVEVFFSGRDAEDVEVEFEEASDGVAVYCDYDGHKRNRSAKIRFEIMVPKEFDLDLETAGGSLNIDGVKGELIGETMGGSLELRNLEGVVKMNTMGGSIELEDSNVDGKVKTMGGSISFINVTGDVDAETMGGSIKQKNVKGNNSSEGKPLHLSTMGGSINVDDVPNGAYLKTMGGSIQVNSSGDYLEVETMGGGIEINEVDGGVDAKTMGGDVYVNMIGDPSKKDRDVTLSSMGGDVELTVPAGLSMTINIEIEYNRKYEDRVDIMSDFDLNIEKTDNWEYNHGEKHKTLTGTGKVGDGKNRIKIRTINGVVKLKKG